MECKLVYQRLQGYRKEYRVTNVRSKEDISPATNTATGSIKEDNGEGKEQIAKKQVYEINSFILWRRFLVMARKNVCVYLDDEDFELIVKYARSMNISISEACRIFIEAQIAKELEDK